MTRHDAEVERAATSLRAAAFALLDSGGTEAEARDAFEAGLAQVRQMHSRRQGTATTAGSSDTSDDLAA